MLKLTDGLRAFLALLALVAFSGTAALAEEISTSQGADFALDGPPAHNWRVELNATMLGSYNENTFESTRLDNAGVSSDLGLDIALRRKLSDSLLTGLRINLLTRIAERRQDEVRYGRYPNTAFVSPMMWTLRYERSNFLNQSFFTPWIEGEAGISLIYMSSAQLPDNGEAIFLRPSARGSLGFDIRPWAGGRFFVSARASYLAVSEFSNSEIGVGSGISF